MAPTADWANSRSRFGVLAWSKSAHWVAGSEITSTRPRAGVARHGRGGGERDQADHDGDQRRHADAPPAARAPHVDRVRQQLGVVAVAVVPHGRRRAEEVRHREHHGGRALGLVEVVDRRHAAGEVAVTDRLDRVAGGPVGGLHPHPRDDRRHLGGVEHVLARGRATSSGGIDPSLPTTRVTPALRPGKLVIVLPPTASKPRNPACWSTASRSLAASPPGPGLLKRSASCFHASVRRLVLFLVVEPTRVLERLDVVARVQLPLVLEPELAGDGGVRLLRGGDEVVDVVAVHAGRRPRHRTSSPTRRPPHRVGLPCPRSPARACPLRSRACCSRSGSDRTSPPPGRGDC